ncbi:MAG: TolC family protein [Acidobacteriota bacterium]
MKLTKSFVFVNILAFSFQLSANPGRAQEAPPTGLSDQALPPSIPTPEYPVPKPYVDRVREEGASLDLSLKEAVRLALLKNLDIEIEDYNEEINRQRLVQNQGFYDPVLSFTIGRSVQDRPTGSVLTAGQGNNVFSSTNFTWNQFFSQNLPGGGSLRWTVNNSRNGTNNLFSTVNPSFSSGMELDFTQPLWRNLVKTSTWHQIKLVNLDMKISDSQFEQRVADVVQEVQNQYWELVFAINNYEARRQSMELAITQYKDNQARVRIGVLAPIEITSAQSEVASRQQEMIQAEVQIVTAQNALKSLLAHDTRDSIWNLSFLPTDLPRPPAVSQSLEEAIGTALSHRPELEQIDFQVEQTEIDHEYWVGQGKPQVNLRVNWGTQGLSGLTALQDRVDTDGDGIPDTVRNLGFRSGNFIDSLGQTFTADFTHYSVFADVQIPLFNHTNKAQVAQTNIEKSRLLSRRRSLQHLIVVDVRNAYESLTIQKKSLEAAQVARRLAQEQLDGESKRYKAGLSTNFEVLRFQRDLVNSKTQEVRSQVDYQKAVVALQKATFTIVNQNDIHIAKRQKTEPL